MPMTASADVLDDLAAQAGFEGRFMQRVFDQNNALLATSAGEFAVLRPDSFRWEVETPDQQVLVITEGVLWQYDQDLETVLRRPAPDDESSPLQLLGADRAALERRYSIAAESGGISLIPRGDTELFERLLITAPASGRLSLVFTDGLAQTIEIDLELTPGKTPSERVFDFKPPEGVEWLEGREAYESAVDLQDSASQ
jgi:chaperone LolA